jgi:hypothetical protein
MMISGMPPTYVAITGSPIAIASGKTMPKHSVLDGRTKTSNFYEIHKTSFLNPANVHLMG